MQRSKVKTCAWCKRFWFSTTFYVPLSGVSVAYSAYRKRFALERSLFVTQKACEGSACLPKIRWVEHEWAIWWQKCSTYRLRWPQISLGLSRSYDEQNATWLYTRPTIGPGYSWIGWAEVIGLLLVKTVVGRLCIFPFMAKWTLVILDGRGWGVGGVTTVCGRDYIAVAGVHETSSQAGAHIL